MSPNGTQPWLMLIDLQRVFGEPDSPWFTPGFDDASRAALRLRDAFGPRVALTRFIPPAQPQGSWVEYYRRSSFALDPANASLFELVSAFPPADSVIIDRPTFSKWDVEVGVRLGRTAEIVLAGVSTDCCILATALGAADAGIHVRIAADACAGADIRSHHRALDVMSLYAPQIEITSVVEVLSTGRAG